MDDLRSTIEAVFRRESGRIIASLIRVSRSFELAEEAMQDALAAALIHWKIDALPENPSAWITAVAQRKLVDHARRERTRRVKEDQLRYETNSIHAPDLEFNMACSSEDDRLRL